MFHTNTFGKPNKNRFHFVLIRLNQFLDCGGGGGGGGGGVYVSVNSHINFFHLPVIKNRTVLADVNKQQDRVERNPHFIKPVSHCYSHETGTPLWRHSLTVVLNNSLLLELLPKKTTKGKNKT